MQEKAINKVVGQIVHKDGTYEIKVHAFTMEEMGLYEEGMRLALKEKDNYTSAILYLDFGELSSLNELDERSLFDMFQFISFNCLRHEVVRIHWGDCVHEYLSKYSCAKNNIWKLSSLTIKKLLDANCGCLHSA
jgi:hypothetical protein